MKITPHTFITFISLFVIVVLFNKYCQQEKALKQCRGKNAEVKFVDKTNIVEYDPRDPSTAISTMTRVGGNQLIQYPDPSEYTLSDRNYGTRQLDAIDRTRNPLRYPYQSIPAFQARTNLSQMQYMNRNLPFQVADGGRRMMPTLEGIPIINSPDAIDIGGANIGAVNIRTRGGIGLPQQMGVLHKVFGNDNEVYPLYGRKRFPRDDKWDYYTMMGNMGVKLRVRNANNNYRNQELNTGDEIEIEGLKDKYRATVYQTDFPEYIPWLPTVPARI